MCVDAGPPMSSALPVLHLLVEGLAAWGLQAKALLVEGPRQHLLVEGPRQHLLVEGLATSHLEAVFPTGKASWWSTLPSGRRPTDIAPAALGHFAPQRHEVALAFACEVQCLRALPDDTAVVDPIQVHAH